MVSFLASAARRHRRLVLLAWLAAVLAGGVLAADLPSRIVPGGDLPADADAARVQREARVPSLYVTVSGLHGRAVSDADVRRAVAAISAREGVHSALARPADRPGTPRVVDVFTGADLEAAIDVAERLDHERRAIAPAGTAVAVGGFAAYREQLARLSLTDLSRAERIGLPLILLVLVLTFGSLRAAALPLAIAVTSVVVGLGLADLVARVTDVADFVTNTASMLGVALGVDYALFVVQRVREEARADGDVHAAVGRAMASTGTAVAWSALVILLAESTLFLVDSRAVRSIALGLVLVTLVALLATVVLLPVALDLLGDRVLRSFWKRRPSGRGWERWAGFVARRPLAVAAAATLALVGFSLPALSLGDHVHAPDTAQLPAALHVRDAATGAAAAHGPGAASPVLLLAEPAARTTVIGAAARLREDRRVADVTISPQPGGRSLLAVETAAGPQSEQSHALVRDLRDGPLSRELTPLRYRAGGETASAIDIRATSFGGLPIVLALLVPLVLVLFALALRSIVLPLKAALLAGLSMTATFGVLVLMTDTELGASLVQQSGAIPIHPVVPVVVIAIAVALTTDYEVVLIGRMRERFVRHGDNAAAVREGLAQTGPVITAAAAIMLVVFGTFASADVFPIKQMGLGLAVIVLFDATIVRAALVPATMHLVGRWNWWTPPRTATVLASAAALSWCGLLVHNAGSLGPQSLLTINTLGPTAVFALIGLLWTTSRRELAATMLRNWVWLHLVVGAGITGLIDPTPTHLAWHAVYGVCQLPLLVALRRRRRARLSPAPLPAT